MVSGPFTIDNKLKHVVGQSQYLRVCDSIELKELSPRWKVLLERVGYMKVF